MLDKKRCQARRLDRAERDNLPSVFTDIAHRKITAVGVMEDHRTDAGFGIHHESFGELHADVLGFEQLPDGGLIFQAGASRIAEAVALAPIAGSEALGHGHLGRIGEAPILTNAAMQPFGAAFGSFDGQSLQAVTQEIVAVVFCFFGALADAFTGGHYEEREVVTLAVLSGQNVIAEAEEVALALPGEAKSVQRLLSAWCKKMQRLAFGLRFEELPDRANFHERSGFLLHFLHALEQLHRFRIAFRQVFFEIAAEAKV